MGFAIVPDFATNRPWENSHFSYEGHAYFVDGWDYYHRLEGEVHCGSVTRHQLLVRDWWNRQP
jgi:hypothetical protein